MLQGSQHQQDGMHGLEATPRREVQNESQSRTSFLMHRAATYWAPEQPLRRMVIMMGCEGSGHHGLGHVLHQAMRAAWQHEGTVGHVIDKEPELFKALAAGRGLCAALEQAVAGKPAKTVAVLGYSFPAHDLKSERATDTHAPIYNVPLISRQAKSCNWALTLLVLRRPIASRVSSRVMIRPGVKLKRFGTTTSVIDYTREQECFDLRVSKMSKQLRHQWPLLEVHYDHFATQAGCSTQLMRMARFLARASVDAEQQAHEPISTLDAVSMTLDDASQFCAQHFRYSRKRPEDALTPSELVAVNATAERLRNGSETCDAWRGSRFGQHARKPWPRAGAKKPS